MAIEPDDMRYLVVVYEESTDIQSIGYLAEYKEITAAEADVRQKIGSGTSPRKVRIFKGYECMFEVITEVRIHKGRPGL